MTRDSEKHECLALCTLALLRAIVVMTADAQVLRWFTPPTPAEQQTP